MLNATVHTDGSCWPNPGGPGGWSCVIELDGKRTELKGHHPDPTTNNRMEIQAAIEALRWLPKWSTVEVITDSQYLRNAGSTWIPLWKRRNWITKEQTPVKNSDLWRELDALILRHRKVKWTWMRSHQNMSNENDRCDTLADEARRGHVEHLLLNHDATDSHPAEDNEPDPF